MSSWLNFDDERFEKGYKPFELTTENIKANKGKRIVFLHKRDINPSRGYAFPKYGTIYGKRYGQLLLDGGHDSVYISDIVECGIKIEDESTPH
jgi:hypothetical protein